MLSITGSPDVSLHGFRRDRYPTSIGLLLGIAPFVEKHATKRTLHDLSRRAQPSFRYLWIAVDTGWTRRSNLGSFKGYRPGWNPGQSTNVKRKGVNQMFTLIVKVTVYFFMAVIEAKLSITHR